MQMYSAYMRYTRTDFCIKNAIGIAASIVDMSERKARAESIAPSKFLSNILCRLYALYHFVLLSINFQDCLLLFFRSINRVEIMLSIAVLLPYLSNYELSQRFKSCRIVLGIISLYSCVVLIFVWPRIFCTVVIGTP